MDQSEVNALPARYLGCLSKELVCFLLFTSVLELTYNTVTKGEGINAFLGEEVTMTCPEVGFPFLW